MAWESAGWFAVVGYVIIVTVISNKIASVGDTIAIAVIRAAWSGQQALHAAAELIGKRYSLKIGAIGRNPYLPNTISSEVSIGQTETDKEASLMSS